MDVSRPGLSSDEVLEDDHVLVLVRFLEHSDQRRNLHGIRGGAGEITIIGNRVQGLTAGDKVLFLLAFNVDDAQQPDTPTRVEGRHCWITQKPRSLSFEEAASLPHAFAVAAVAVCSTLQETLPNLLDRLHTYSKDPTERARLESPTSAILVVGGSTLIGAAIVQLLRMTVPDCLLLTTIGPGSHEESELSDLAIDQILLGADYAIDHEAREDPENDAQGLNHHLRAVLHDKNLTGLECIIDTLGDLGGRGEDLLNLFSGSGRRIVDVSPGTSESGALNDSVDLSRDRILTMPGAENLMATLGALLQADKFRLPKHTPEGS